MATSRNNAHNNITEKPKTIIDKPKGFIRRLRRGNEMTDITDKLGMKIYRLSNEISLIDNIIEDGYTETLNSVFEEDKEIVTSYKNKSKDYLLECRKKLEAELACI